MRLRRIRVEHVRAIDAMELRLAEQGVTVIEAPNESGKTTLLDAVDVVLTHKDSTRRHEVRSLQPAGRDVGSLVELELTCGPVHLTVRKRFNRDRMTELEVHAPVRQQLTGDEAHDELRRILETSTDLALYDALRFRQGRSLDSLALGGSGSLAARLDEIAGGSGDTADDALLARVRSEFERYFTPSGQDGQVLRAADAAVAASQERVDSLSDRLHTIESDAQRQTELERERSALAATLAQLEPSLVEHRRRSERVRSLREELRTREAQAAVANGELERARRELRDRDELVAKVAQLRDAVAARAPVVATAVQHLDTHAERLSAAEDEVAAAEDRERAARVALDAARAAADIGRRREELAQLVARQQRVDAALAAASDAEAALESDAMTDRRLEAIRDAADRLRLAESRLDDAAPTIVIRSHGDLKVSVDGVGHTLVCDEALERSVPDRTSIDVPGLLGIEVRAGSSLADRQAEVERARQELQDVCADAGVDDLATAEQRLRDRHAHERALEERDASIARELAGWSREELADRVRTRTAQLRDLEARLGPAEAQESDADPQLTFVVDGGVAAHRLAEVEARDIAARDAAEQARSERAGLAQHVERLRGEVRVATADLEAGERELEDHERRLEDARERADDGSLATAAETASRTAVAARRAVEDAGKELEELGADRVELLAGNAEQRAQRARHDLSRVRDELTELRARIEVRGGEGIGEALQQATAELDRDRAAAQRLGRRAAAAAALREAFERAREAAYAAYREPLRDRIVRAGRVVFGDSLDVELDDELRVVARHLDGTVLPWERLSAGAQEQLAILTALAAADLAGGNGDDGVPLVLDDTLGFTDPDRLERLCAVLGRVRGPQVVVLTCVGERFQAIGGATVVRLRDQGGRAAGSAVA